MNVRRLDEFLHEDAPYGDITTRAIFGNKPCPARGILLAKENLVLSGTAIVGEILKKKFPALKLKLLKHDGEAVKKGTSFGEMHGPVQDLLRTERLCLNIIQRMSGIATLTSRFVQLAKPHRITILDTRKTTPGLRAWEKRAVRDGGGVNHRMNLSDQYLIKDNHIAAAGSVTVALERVIAHRSKLHRRVKIEVEVTNLAELAEALLLKPDIVLLDNMTPTLIRRAVKMRNEMCRVGAVREPPANCANARAQHAAPLLEISGGVTLKTLPRFLSLGVERISVGALTHSAPAVDISLEVIF